MCKSSSNRRGKKIKIKKREKKERNEVDSPAMLRKISEREKKTRHGCSKRNTTLKFRQFYAKKFVLSM